MLCYNIVLDLETIKDDSLLTRVHLGMTEEEFMEEEFDKQVE